MGKGTLPTGDLWECVENGKVQKEFNFFVNFCHGEVEVEIFWDKSNKERQYPRMSRNEEITEKQQENKLGVRFVACVTVELENFLKPEVWVGFWVERKLEETFWGDKSIVCEVAFEVSPRQLS